MHAFGRIPPASMTPTGQMTRPQVLFLPAFEALRMVPPAHWAAISITDRRSEPAALHRNWECLHRVSFDDVEHDIADRFIGMSDQQAYRVVRYLERIRRRGDVHGIMVHCGAGVSRSAAVAVFAAAYFGVAVNGNAEGLNVDVLRRLKKAAARRLLSSPSRRMLRAALCRRPDEDGG